ncbi:beta-ketoacyl-ACP reductase [Tengunoibacter tsumagoiensis]|uniref:Beta-ketoacyl-ACP reductase n=2 Tax=Tengunoibacter tsumagoiensis TaxID=2014871 RepID=A0A402A8Z0_9CHLR|nr:beta-ketoacyl-ACP reductase [Tengunoibacter tsumagoiensis]
MQWKDKYILVAGASGVLGQAIVEAFLQEEATVIALYFRHPDRLYSLLHADKADERQLQIVQVDLTDAHAVHSFFEQLEQTLPALDVLINAAGGARPLRLEEVTLDEWNACLQMNLTAPFLCAQSALPLLQQRGGNIINIASVAGLTGGAFGPHYATVKAGVIGLTRNLAREIGSYGIRVNTIAPGPVASPMTEALPPPLLEKIVAETALHRILQPAEIAETVIWLAGTTAMTGQTVVVDGGRYFL